MRKITALICVTIIIISLFSACGFRDPEVSPTYDMGDITVTRLVDSEIFESDMKTVCNLVSKNKRDFLTMVAPAKEALNEFTYTYNSIYGTMLPSVYKMYRTALSEWGFTKIAATSGTDDSPTNVTFTLEDITGVVKRYVIYFTNSSGIEWFLGSRITEGYTPNYYSKNEVSGRLEFFDGSHRYYVRRIDDNFYYIAEYYDTFDNMDKYRQTAISNIEEGELKYITCDLNTAPVRVIKGPFLNLTNFGYGDFSQYDTLIAVQFETLTSADIYKYLTESLASSTDWILGRWFSGATIYIDPTSGEVVFNTF